MVVKEEEEPRREMLLWCITSGAAVLGTLLLCLSADRKS